MLAGDRKARHPTHCQRVGAAAVVMAGLQARLLSLDRPPVVASTPVEEAAMLRRYGPQLGPLCIAEMRKTALDGPGADRLNRLLSAIWPTLRAELAPMAIPAAELAGRLRDIGAPTTGQAPRPSGETSR